MVFFVVLSGLQFKHGIGTYTSHFAVDNKNSTSGNPKKQHSLHILHDDAAITRFLKSASDLVGTNGTTTRLPSAELHDQDSGVIWIQFCDQIVPVKR